MGMEVVVPMHSNLDFDFNGARSGPLHLGSPGSPKGFGEFYTSAPTSPSRLSQLYREFDDFLTASSSRDAGGNGGGGSEAAVPFVWEEKPGTPKSSSSSPRSEDDFAFHVGEDWAATSLTAEELFDGGVIKPLKPPPRLQIPAKDMLDGGGMQSQSTVSKKIILGAFSPRHKKEGTGADIGRPESQEPAARRSPERQRGRERGPAGAGLSSSSRRAARSLSPMRVSQYPWEEEEEEERQSRHHHQPGNGKTEPSLIAKPSPNSAISALASFSKKFRFTDFFLFRSKSEGRASDKDPLRKYTAAAFRRHEEAKNSSQSLRFSSSPAGYSSSSSSFVALSQRRKGRVSAHEMHYTVNKAVSEDLKKKTFLPYKQGILGRLAFNPTVHALANGFGISQKSHK